MLELKKVCPINNYTFNFFVFFIEPSLKTSNIMFLFLYEIELMTEIIFGYFTKLP